MRRFLFIILLGLSDVVFAQETQDTLTAVVRDAETGEPVPYASIYVSPSFGTISNYEGEFSLACLPSDVVRISSIGYKQVSFTASELPSVVQMSPISTTMRELTVMGVDDVLYRLVRKMQKEAKKHKKAEGRYFFRLITQYPGTDELAEAFLSAKSSVQIRDLTFHSGNRGRLKAKTNVFENPDLKGLGRTNLHVFLRLAPVLVTCWWMSFMNLVNFDFWDLAIVPADLVLLRRGKLYYDASCLAYTEDDGTEMRKIRLVGKTDVVSSPILEGTMYVDYKKCQLLRFEGQMRNLYLRTYDNARRRSSIDTVKYEMHIDYRHDHGFSEIANMSGTIVKDSVKLRYLMYGLGDKEITFQKSKRVGDNMLATIDEVGYDSTLWQMTDIVKRTKAEERVAFGDTAFHMRNRSNYDVAPSQQEADANAYLREALRKLKGNTMQLHRGLPQK